MRQTRKLTERVLRTLKPHEKPYKRFDGDGLSRGARPGGGSYALGPLNHAGSRAVGFKSS